jgi:hypothetical protein
LKEKERIKEGRRRGRKEGYEHQGHV